jgi:hypothetical protein
VLRRIIAPKTEEGAVGWRRLHNEDLYNVFASPNIILVIKSRRMKWKEHVTHMEEIINSYKILVGKSERKRPLGRPRRRWEDDIRMDLREVRWEGVDWMYLVEDRDQWRSVVNTVVNLRVP